MVDLLLVCLHDRWQACPANQPETNGSADLLGLCGVDAGILDRVWRAGLARCESGCRYYPAPGLSLVFLLYVGNGKTSRGCGALISKVAITAGVGLCGSDF